MPSRCRLRPVPLEFGAVVGLCVLLLLLLLLLGALYALPGLRPLPNKMKDDFDEEDFKSADEPQKEVNPDFGSGVLSGVEALLLGESFVIFGYDKLTNGYFEQ